MNDHQRVQHADPQRGRAIAADMAGHPRRCPDQQGQAGQHAQPQQHGSGHHVVADEHGDELRDQNEPWPVRCSRRRPDRTHVVQQRVRVVDRADDVRVEAVAQQCALRQIRIGVATEHRNGQQERRQPESGRRHHRVFGCGAVDHPAAQPQPGGAPGRDRIGARTGAVTQEVDRAAGCCPRPVRPRWSVPHPARPAVPAVPEVTSRTTSASKDDAPARISGPASASGLSCSRRTGSRPIWRARRGRPSPRRRSARR